MKPFYNPIKKEFTETFSSSCIATEDLIMMMMSDVEAMKKKLSMKDTNEFGTKPGEELSYVNVSPTNFGRIESVGVGNCLKVLCSDGVGGFTVQILDYFEQPKEEEENLSPREKMIKKNLIIPAENLSVIRLRKRRKEITEQTWRNSKTCSGQNECSNKKRKRLFPG